MNSKRETRELIQLLNKTSIPVLNNIIYNYLGEGITKYCDICEEISNEEDWLVYGAPNDKENWEKDFCPNCYGVCCNHLCKEIIEVEELYENENCDEDNGKYCSECIDDYVFYCESCDTMHCLADSSNNNNSCMCNGATECDDCGVKYCSTCRADDGIFLCEADCNEWSCCRKFININEELVCENCINKLWIKPYSYKEPNRHNKFN